MSLRIQLFASARERLGKDSVEIELELPTTVVEIRRSLANAFPELNQLLAISRIAVDRSYCSENQTIDNAVEIALIPPVSGG